MSDRYTFTTEGRTWADVTENAKQIADEFWSGTPYEMTIDADGDAFRQLGGGRPDTKAEVTTRRIGPSSVRVTPPNAGRPVG